MTFLPSLTGFPPFTPERRYGGGFNPLTLAPDFLTEFALDTVFQSSEGFTAGAVGQPAGFVFDVAQMSGKSLAQFLAGQSDQIGAGAIGMVGTATPATYSAGVGSVSRTDISNQSYVIFTGLAPSTYHYLDITNGAAVLGVRTGTQSGATMASLAANGRRTAMVPSDSSGRITLTAVTNATATSFTVHEFKAVPGAHMSQITGGARPTLRAGSPYYTEYDGSDDNLLGTALAGTANTLAARITVPASIAATQAIMGLQGSSTTRLWLALNTSGQLCGAVGSNGVGTILGSADIRGQTGVAILTHDGSTINLCWNGILVYTGSQNGSPSTTTPFRYGAQNNAGSAGNYTTAQLHKLLSKQAALSLPEIAALSAAWR